MNIVNILTKKHLKENRGRTIVTVMGIAISAAMITAVFSTVTSFFAFFGKLSVISDGRGIATFKQLSLSDIEQLKQDERIDRVGIINGDGSENGYNLHVGETRFVRRGSIYTGDIVALEQIVSCKYEGVLPQNSNEIAVEDSLIDELNGKFGIGDTLSLDIGRRTEIDEEGEEKDYHGVYNSEEKFYYKDTKDYTITAILHKNMGTGNYRILRGVDGSELAAIPSGKLSAMIELKKLDFRSYNALMRMVEQYEIEKYGLNTELLDANFSLRKGSSFVELLPLFTFVIVSIIAFSVVLIYNAFGMSLAERVKYLGMLASVGATRFQKRMSVYFEGFLLGIVGIPIGIGAGIAGIAITLRLVGKRILVSGMFPAVDSTAQIGDVSLVVPIWLIPSIIIVCALTIFVAAFIPARRASKIMPIDAIRQTNEIKVKSGELRVPRIVGKIFGYEGELAYKNMKRNGRKGKVIIFSIIASLVMFFGMNHFCKLFWESNSKTYNMPFDVYATVSYDERERLLEELEQLSNIDDMYGIDMFVYSYKKGDAKSPNTKILNPEHFTRSYRRVFSSEMTLILHLVSDEDFINLCNSQNIDPAPYFGDETNALLVNNVSYTKHAKEAFSEAMLGQKLYYDDKENNNPAEVTLKEFVKWENNPHIMGFSSKNTVTAIIPYSNYVKTVYGDDHPEGLCYSVGVETSEHKKVCDDIKCILEKGNYKETTCMDMIESQGIISTLIYVMEVFTYGFVTLITLISVTNIINTVSTGIAQRRKEFAVLKSVGMTPAGFSKMIKLESYLFGIKSTLWGIPISLGVCFLMNWLLPTTGFISPNYLILLIAVLVIFGLIRLSMMFAVTKLKRDTIVEVLKEDLN